MFGTDLTEIYISGSLPAGISTVHLTESEDKSYTVGKY